MGMGSPDRDGRRQQTMNALSHANRAILWDTPIKLGIDFDFANPPTNVCRYTVIVCSPSRV